MPCGRHLEKCILTGVFFVVFIFNHYLTPLPTEVMPPRRNEKYKLPVPLPEGKVLNDTEGKQWVLGKMIDSGGFGLIYLGKV